MQNAWKVGLLAVGFLAAMFGAYAILGRSLFAVPTSTYRAVFVDAGGVVPGSPVLMSGVRVGQVSNLQLEGPGRAVMVLELEEKIKVPAGSTVVIASSLIGIGDRPVEIIPPKIITSMLEPGAELQGVLKSPLESLSPESQETLQALNETLRATQSLLQDQQLRSRVADLLESTNKTVTDFGVLANQITRVVSTNQGQVAQTLGKASEMLDDLSTATEAIARIASDGKLEGQLTALMTDMSATLKESNALVSDLRKTVNDPELQGPMKGILANTQAMTESGVRISENAEKIAANGVTLSAKAVEIADKASKLADELSEVLRRFDRALGGVAGIGASTGVGTIETEAALIRESSPGRFRSDYELTVPFGGQKYHLGIYDAFESNRLIAQLSRPAGSNTDLRYGVYASKPGVGLVHRFSPTLSFRGDLFDVNDPRLDASLRFDFNRNIRGWLSLQEVFSGSRPAVGISIRR